jgi:ribosomal-protein-alanine N-acetyltransferase
MQGTAELEALLAATVADEWTAFPGALQRLWEDERAGETDPAWGTTLFLLAAPRTLIGMGGFTGAPECGIVEFGYGIAPAYRGRGLATEGAKELVRRAFRHPSVVAVEARTRPIPGPSTRVLEKLGLQRIGEQVDPDEGLLWHYRLERCDADRYL